jgi:von Willebrand factor type A domain
MANSCVQLSWHPEYPHYGFASTSASCLISLKAPDVPDSKRAAISLSVVLDASASMSGSPLERVKEAVTFLTKQLSDHDQISVIAFGSEVWTACVRSKYDGPLPHDVCNTDVLPLV